MVLETTALPTELKARMNLSGRGSRIRTYECQDQNLVPYRLAIPHRYPEVLLKIGEPIGIRTPDTRLRRPLLYPAEL